MATVQIKLPPKLIPVFSKPSRYKGAYGGRGSGKTRTFAKMTAVYAYMAAKAGKRGVILCGREYQNSLEDSSLEEVKEAIRSEPFLNDFFEIGDKYVRTKCKSIHYVFAGLRHNLDSLKSKAKILLCWVDEAETVSELAWSKLTPTVREENSEIWVTWNPESRESATNKRFRKRMPKDALIVEMNYMDNPWFPDVLEQERQSDFERLDAATYAWIWEGAYLERSDAQVFKDNYVIAEFEPQKHWHGPYFGLDFGFAKDPTVTNKLWVSDDVLYIEHEAGKVGLELDDTAPYMIERVPEIEKHVIYGDSARPESISYLSRHGLPYIRGVEKGKGSVEDGIAHIKSYKKVVIHPRCKETIREFKLYSYKVDRLSGDVLPILVDANNHYIDSIRYGLSPLIKNKGEFKQKSLSLY
ncbi:PBSX family phage terminase large subunit [Pasteurellaceae bacterium USgator11]|nr:PBSX family phage terminase large subunit [Pasteurellaceae bacterium USgator41]TNG96470.1 PBSX family phage terminase large subunit [Pasteurellaceae bacterium UScroc12]TNH00448.1 PBSX family phage terminase large subunit [Pasteurellaceae bacterium UScroc31]TNH01721.1 PBSX family phage terminase large subunit [Pasteurellaceae bacterium USgator11]